MSAEPEQTRARADHGTQQEGGGPAPRSLQPWSDAARRISSRARERRTGRARQLARFNDALAEMIVRDAEEEQTIASIVNIVLRATWAPVMLAGGVLIHRYTGTTKYTARELAGYLSLSVIIGLAIDPLWRLVRGDPSAAPSGPDPYGVDQEAVGFTTLGLERREEGEADGQ